MMSRFLGISLFLVLIYAEGGVVSGEVSYHGNFSMKDLDNAKPMEKTIDKGEKGIPSQKDGKEENASREDDESKK